MRLTVTTIDNRPSPIDPSLLRSRSAIIFDLDGTLTRPYLDFDAIRTEIGLPSGPILEGIERLPETERCRAHAILANREREAAENSELQEDAREVIDGIRRAGHPVAIMTRNSRVSTDHILRVHRLTVDFIRTREDGTTKPSPEPVHAICERLHTLPAESWVIGDYLFDIQSGAAAGARTVLMVGDHPLPAYAAEANHVIQRLRELLPLLKFP